MLSLLPLLVFSSWSPLLRGKIFHLIRPPSSIFSLRPESFPGSRREDKLSSSKSSLLILVPCPGSLFHVPTPSPHSTFQKRVRDVFKNWDLLIQKIIQFNRGENLFLTSSFLPHPAKVRVRYLTKLLENTVCLTGPNRYTQLGQHSKQHRV